MNNKKDLATVLWESTIAPPNWPIFFGSKRVSLKSQYPKKGRK